MLIMQATVHDIINLLNLFIQAYQDQLKAK